MSADPRRPGLSLSRRSFLTAAAGGVAAVTLSGCVGRSAAPTDGSSSAAGAAGGHRALILVEMGGGNDGLSALVPADGRYRDARPTLAVPEHDLVSLEGTTEVALHPDLAPLAPLWAGGRLAAVRGIGFSDPNRSHFVSMDRWWRADRGSTAPGWLAAWLDSVDADSGPLAGTGVGGRAPQLSGGRLPPTTLNGTSGFRFKPATLRDGLVAMSQPAAEVDLVALAQAAMSRSVDAVAQVASLDISAHDGPLGPSQPFTAGLTLAAEIVAAASGPTVVVVSGGGFDTHAGQLAVHKRLYPDLAAGIAAYFDKADASGFADRSLLVTTSEFGRRMAENGSGGTDHGAGNTTFMVGPSVVSGLHGDIDLGQLLDGDVRPTIDPRAVYTACLDWLDADVEAALGQRYDDTALLQA